MIINCTKCGKEKKISPSKLKDFNFCSLECARSSQERAKKISDTRKRKFITQGFLNSPETREKIRKANTGKTATKEARAKMSKRGRNRRHSDKTKQKITKLLMGHKVSETTREKLRQANVGRPQSRETRERRANSSRGEKSHFWRGGITETNKLIRTSFEYKLWRSAVFERDKWTCVFCGIKFIKGQTGNIRFEADHIKPFSLFPELRFAIDNGRTLCKSCHLTTETYGGKIKKII